MAFTTSSPAREKSRLRIDQTGQEYGKWDRCKTFPVVCGRPRLSDYCNNTFELHWHDGPELTVIVEGRMEYLVNDRRYDMSVGDFVFVNSGAMHQGRAVDPRSCSYVTLSFLPSAIIDGDPDGPLCEKYFGGRMDSRTLASVFFTHDSPEGQEAGRLCLAAYELLGRRSEGWELELRGLLCRVWSLLWRAAGQREGLPEEPAMSVDRIKKAIRYMNENYRSHISLEDIASACNLSRSELCRCFKRITRQTPFDYLMGLRVRRSIAVLEKEGSSVTEAALASGFSGSSYYTEVFRRYMNCTPREYLKRRKNRENV